jgi:hypothetical protein
VARTRRSGGVDLGSTSPRRNAVLGHAGAGVARCATWKSKAFVREVYADGKLEVLVRERDAVPGIEGVDRIGEKAVADQRYS